MLLKDDDDCICSFFCDSLKLDKGDAAAGTGASRQTGAGAGLLLPLLLLLLLYADLIFFGVFCRLLAANNPSAARVSPLLLLLLVVVVVVVVVAAAWGAHEAGCWVAVVAKHPRAL